MDSVTQAVLGATVAAAIAPAGHRRKALLIGAALGTVPDLDVLIDFGGAIENFTMHRGFSHSLWVLPFVGLALWGALLALWPAARVDRWRWLAAFEAALVTHPLLDAFTVYGTQLFWPMTTPPVSIGSIFIIDPAYTLPLLMAAVAAAIFGARPRAKAALVLALLVSSGYLGWSLIAQSHIEGAVRAALDADGVADAKALVTPTPFNTLLWRIVVVYPDGDYGEGYYSFIDRPETIRLTIHPGNARALAPLRGEALLQRLEWFTHGFIAAEVVDGRVVAKDLRMGVEGAYVFRFAVGAIDGASIRPLEPVEQLPWPSRDWARITAIWRAAREAPPAAAPETGDDRLDSALDNG